MRRRTWKLPTILAMGALVVGLVIRPAGLSAGDVTDQLVDEMMRELKVARPAKPAGAAPAPKPAAATAIVPQDPTTALDTPVYVPKADLGETYRASMSARRRVALGPWYSAGPFDDADGNGWQTVYEPQRRVDMAAQFTGPGGRTFGWRRWDNFRDGSANALDLGGRRGKGAVGFLYRRLLAPEAVEVPIALGSAHSIAVWLNGREVLSRKLVAARPCIAGQEVLWLQLALGENDLLVKYCSDDGRAEFACADNRTMPEVIDDAIVRRAQRDFAVEGASPRDLAIERDWFARDRELLAKGGCEAAGRNALALARRTLAMVERAAPRPKMAAELAGLEKQLAAPHDAGEWSRLYLQARRLRRRIVLSHPLLDFNELLVVKRGPPLYSHMCDQYLGRHSRGGEGLVVLENWRDEATCRPLIPPGKLPPGAVHHPDLSWDGRRVVFAFCPHTEQDRTKRWFYLWEAAVDGSSVRQLTGVPGRDPLKGQDGRQSVYIEDWDPCYLPDGDIVFISTRNQGYGRCHGGRYTPSYVLYRCDGDGNRIRRISWGEANEWDPSVLHDGRIIYTRWDYINRHDTVFQSLWTTRPDGTATAHYYGNYTRNPCMIAEARAVPGSHRAVATTMGHHSYTAGSTILIDPLKGLDGPEPLQRVTPEVSFPETEGRPTGAFATPWPLSEELFLAAYTPDRLAFQGGQQRTNAYGIYLVDTAGGRELIYRDEDISCFTPIPLVPRETPPAIASGVEPAAAEGTFYLRDVYVSGSPVPAGQAKHLRVVGIIGQPTASVPTRSRANNEIVKWIVGTVPIGRDGSVAFRAPADVPLLFQVLDANGMSVLSMRSLVYLQGGEKMSCVGCHEPAGTTPRLRAERPLEVLTPSPPPGPAYEGGFSFARTVQPVLDRYCIRCHGLGQAPPVAPAPMAAPVAPTTADDARARALAELSGKRLNKPSPSKPAPAAATAGPVTLLGTPTGSFNEAYDCLTGRAGLIRIAQRNGETVTSKSMDYGSHASRLAPLLLGGHGGRVKLDRDSFLRIAGWLDLNVQYYGDYSFKRAERRRPDAAGEQALRGHVRRHCGRCHPSMDAQPLAALVNIAWPDASRVLKAVLPLDAGGWGQCKQTFPSATDEQYRLLREKVLAATGEPDKAVAGK